MQAFFIIALFNYINLSIAQIASRFVEAGVKKVVGASFTNLYYQLLVETSMYVFIAILLSNFFLESIMHGIQLLYRKEHRIRTSHKSGLNGF